MSLSKPLFILFISLLLASSACQINKQSNSSKDQVVVSEKVAIVSKLSQNSHLPIGEQIDLYKKLKKEKPEVYDFSNEDQLTMYGYRLLWDDKVYDAMAIFQLIVDEFPNSANAYDSLGEAYLTAGDTRKALVNYERALKMNPENFNAEDQIERIMHPERVPPTPAERFVQVFSPEQYRADLDQLAKQLIKINPSTLKFTAEEDFNNLVEAQKALVTEQTTYSEFRWLCSKIVAAVNCSHTSMGDFYPENEMLPLRFRFPLQSRWTQEKLFVTDPFNNKDQVAIKDEILSINGIEIGRLMEEIYQHIPSQGHIKTTKKHFFNNWTTGMIPYALGFPEKYTIQLKGKSQPITLNQAEIFNDPAQDLSIKACNNNLCLDYLSDGKSAVLTVASFNYYNWNNYQEFVDFMDKSFKELQKKKIKNLILDLRFNGGGSPESSIYLLRYLVNEPFQYFADSEYPAGNDTYEPFAEKFSGQLYFLIDGHGNSTTGHFMAIVKDKKMGTIIGEELGSNQYCTAGQTVCRLSNTKLVFYVANTISKLTITSLPDEKGILPDHYVEQDIEAYLHKEDQVMNFAKELIKQSY